MRTSLLVLALVSAAALFAQELPRTTLITLPRDTVDADKLPAAFYAGRREALRALLPEHGVAVFSAGTMKNRSNDVNYEFHQDPDFHYLTGVDEPDAVLFVFKETHVIRGEAVNELLVVRDRDAKAELWTGERLGADGARAVSGAAMALGAFAFTSADLPVARDSLFGDPPPESKAYDRVRQLTMKKGDLDHWMAELRQQKRPEELTLLRRAIDITCEAERTLMQALEPGMTEYQAEAIVQYVFTAGGAEHEGYPSIVGGGAHSCVLHYETNRGTLKAGTLLVSDVGAEYHGYTADVTRTLPVGGRFSPEQKLIYELELRAQEAGIAEVKAGQDFHAPHRAATKVITDGLMELGIIHDPADVKRYFPHGTSHYLGLDVHDAGLYGPLEAGQVITVEPGIYIPAGSPCDPKWWDIGIRIEDDVLVTTGEAEVLSACVPKTVAEIEALMAKPVEALPLPR